MPDSYKDKNSRSLSSLDKETQKALRESASMFRIFSEQLLMGIVILQDGVIKYVNQAVANLLGYSIKEIMEWPPEGFARVIHPDHLEFALMQARKKQSGRKDVVDSYSYQVITKSGNIRWVRQYSKTILFEGRYADLVTFVDITKARQAELALIESEDRYRRLFETALEGIAIVDDKENIELCNNALARIFEEDSASTMAGKNLLNYIPDDQRDTLLDQTERRRRNVSSRYELSIRTARGKLRTVFVSVIPRLDSENNYIGAFGTMIDITERKKAETELMEARDILETRVKDSAVELTEANRQLRKSIFDLYTIFELSRNFNALLEYDSLLDSFILAAMSRMGASLAALYLPSRTGKMEFELAKVKGTEQDMVGRVSFDPEGIFGKYITALNRPIQVDEIVYKFSAEENIDFVRLFKRGLIIPLVFQTKLRGMLILSGKSTGQQYRGSDIEFLSILANQTAVSIENARLYESEREAIRKLQETQRLLVQSERSAALGELSARVAHEVNNPLGIIKNYLFLLSKNIDDTNKTTEYVDVVRQEIDRIAAIIKQLLSFHRPALAKFEKTDPGKLVSELISLMERQFSDSDIKVHFEPDEDVPIIMAWPDGLKQVFMNLFVNARDAMTEGGELYVRINAGRGTIRFDVEDTGPGIKKENIPHIFDSFFTTKSSIGGTGLGLSISQRIIKNHNGSISFKNTESGGCFTIILPTEQKDIEYDWGI
jgi:PAS domain S-box-containing protein